MASELSNHVQPQQSLPTASAVGGFNFEASSSSNMAASDPSRLSTFLTNDNKTAPTNTHLEANETMKKQFQELETFEKEQQLKLIRDLDDHKRQIEAQQAEHRKVLGRALTMRKLQTCSFTLF